MLKYASPHSNLTATKKQQSKPLVDGPIARTISALAICWLLHTILDNNAHLFRYYRSEENGSATVGAVLTDSAGQRVVTVRRLF